MMTKTKAVQALLADIENIEQLLAPYLNEVNIFQVLKLTDTEIRHSNMLAWLLDAEANHGLGEDFAKRLFAPLPLTSYHFKVYREHAHIDILLVDDIHKIVITIENKIWSRQHGQQLETYKDFIAANYEEKGFKSYYFYLTPEGRESAESGWQPISYKAVVKSLAAAKKNKPLKPAAELLIENYLTVLRRDILTDKNDELIALCNKIYKEHKTALKLIYKYQNESIAEEIHQTLRQMHQDGLIVYDFSKPHNKAVFHTKMMSKNLPDLTEKSSAWNTRHIYNYELTFTDDKLTLIFTVSVKNIPAEIMKKFECKGGNIYATIQLLSKPYTQETIKQDLQELVQEMLQWQDKILKEIG